MKFLLSLLLVFTAVPSLASQTSVQGGFGMNHGLMHLVLDVDFQKQRSHSFGGYLIYGIGEDSSAGGANRGTFWSVGGDFKVYMGSKKWKLYAAPGAGIINFENVSGSESEMSLAALFKIGALAEVSDGMFLGLEQVYLNNWLSDETYGGTYLLTNLAFRMNI